MRHTYVYQVSSSNNKTFHAQGVTERGCKNVSEDVKIFSDVQEEVGEVGCTHRDAPNLKPLFWTGDNMSDESYT